MEKKDGWSFVEIQNWMQHIIMLQDVTIAEDTEAKDIINASVRLSAVRHLDIYRGSYIARLRECMRNQFSALAYALGRELFEAFADQYLDAHPSHSYTLNALGEHFSNFLEDTRPDAGQDKRESWPDFMIELAAFEYALSIIFDEHSSVEAQLANADTPDEELIPSPVMQLFYHQYPICRYYLDFTQQKKPELPFPEESFSVVTRIHYRLGLFDIRSAQFHFLTSLKAGATIQRAKDELTSNFNFPATEVESIWPQWRKYFIASGILVTR